MSATVTLLAFRCNQCWRLTTAEIEQVGKTIPCICCSAPVDVPEATAERIAAVADLDTEQMSPEEVELDDELTDEERIQLARQNAVERVQQSGHQPAVVMSSRWRRLFGVLVDGIAGTVAVFAGAMLLPIMFAEPNPESAEQMLVMFLPAIVFGICQMCMLTEHGRTVGKFAVGTKIIVAGGSPPGFYRGVVLRVFAVSLLGFVPFFGLVDALWIFGEQKRCIHDLIAGTWVVDA